MFSRKHSIIAGVIASLYAEAGVVDGSGATAAVDPAVVAAAVPAEVPVAGSPAAIAAAVNAKTDAIKVEKKFHFKKDKLGNKRPTISLAIPKPTLDGVINGLGDEKIRDFILEILEEVVYKAARDQVGDDNKPVNKQEELDTSRLTLNFLANMPKAERTGGGISKETWEEFGADYAAVMPSRTNFSTEQIANAVKIFVGRFQPVKTQKKIITFLKGQLALWFANTPNQEDFQEVYDFLDQKAETLLAADEASLLANLGG